MCTHFLVMCFVFVTVPFSASNLCVCPYCYDFIQSVFFRKENDRSIFKAGPSWNRGGFILSFLGDLFYFISDIFFYRWFLTITTSTSLAVHPQIIIVLRLKKDFGNKVVKIRLWYMFFFSNWLWLWFYLFRFQINSFKQIFCVDYVDKINGLATSLCLVTKKGRERNNMERNAIKWARATWVDSQRVEIKNKLVSSVYFYVS